MRINAYATLSTRVFYTHGFLAAAVALYHHIYIYISMFYGPINRCFLIPQPCTSMFLYACPCHASHTMPYHANVMQMPLLCIFFEPIRSQQKRPATRFPPSQFPILVKAPYLLTLWEVLVAVVLIPSVSVSVSASTFFRTLKANAFLTLSICPTL